MRQKSCLFGLMVLFLTFLKSGAIQIPYYTVNKTTILPTNFIYVQNNQSLTNIIQVNSITSFYYWLVKTTIPYNSSIYRQLGYEFAYSLQNYSMSHIITETGFYAVAIQIQDNSQKLFLFKIKSIVDGITIKQNSQIIGNKFNKNSVVVEINTNKSCRAKISWQGPPSIFKIFSPASSIYTGSPIYTNNNTNTTFFQFNFTTPGVWNLVAVNNLSSNVFISLSRAIITITTFSDNSCFNFCSDKGSVVALAQGSTDTCVCDQRYNDFYWNSSTKSCVCRGQSCPICGDAILNKYELCDNGNMTGCSIGCIPDIGYYCTGSPSICKPICGDNIRVGEQKCDNGNKTGCSNNCIPDQGYYCNQDQTSSCWTICGDNIKAESQLCDNGNQAGCSKQCSPDQNYYCTGSPSVCILISLISTKIVQTISLQSTYYHISMTQNGKLIAISDVPNSNIILFNWDGTNYKQFSINNQTYMDVENRKESSFLGLSSNGWFLHYVSNSSKLVMIDTQKSMTEGDASTSLVNITNCEINKCLWNGNYDNFVIYYIDDTGKLTIKKYKQNNQVWQYTEQQTPASASQIKNMKISSNGNLFTHKTFEKNPNVTFWVIQPNSTNNVSIASKISFVDSSNYDEKNSFVYLNDNSILYQAKRPSLYLFNPLIPDISSSPSNIKVLGPTSKIFSSQNQNFIAILQMDFIKNQSSISLFESKQIKKVAQNNDNYLKPFWKIIENGSISELDVNSDGTIVSYLRTNNLVNQLVIAQRQYNVSIDTKVAEDCTNFGVLLKTPSCPLFGVVLGLFISLILTFVALIVALICCCWKRKKESKEVGPYNLKQTIEQKKDKKEGEQNKRDGKKDKQKMNEKEKKNSKQKPKEKQKYRENQLDKDKKGKQKKKEKTQKFQNTEKQETIEDYMKQQLGSAVLFKNKKVTL